MKGIYVPLDFSEREVIIKLAQTERRDPRQQAALLIRQRLETLGLLPASQPQATPEKAGRQ
jgi:hypothetical protein